MSIDPKFVKLRADVLQIFYFTYGTSNTAVEYDLFWTPGIYGSWPLTDPGVEAERAVPGVSRSWRRKEGVADLTSKRRERRGAEVSWRSPSKRAHGETFHS